MKTVMRRLMTVTFVLAIAGAAGFTPTVLAETPTPESHATHHPGTATAETSSDASAGAVMQDAAGTPMGGMQMPQEFDLMLIDMMIPHHEGAIAMAEVARERGEHPELVQLAEQIIADQQEEIATMQAWREAWYPDAPEMPMDQMMGGMGMMMQMMPGMQDMAGMMGMGMMGMMAPEAQAQALRDATGPFDLAFLNAMIPHHLMALMMAEMAVQQATHPELAELHEAMFATQTEEIAMMQQWRAEWFAGTPTAGVSDVTAVEVRLTDFAVESSVTTLQRGQSYRFIVTNVGQVPHEFMVMPPVRDMGSMGMADLDDIALAMIPAADLPPGGSGMTLVTIPAALEDDVLELVCAEAGHYDAGMRLTVAID